MTLLRTLAHAVAQTIAFLFFLILFAIAVGVVQKGIELAGRLSWLLGLAIGVIWITLAFTYCLLMWYAMRPGASPGIRQYMLIPKDRRDEAPLTHRFPEAATTAMTCVVILVAVVSMADVSEILASKGFIRYEGMTTGSIPSTEKFMNFYLWHAFDMIPFVDLWQTYDVEPPLRPANLWARTFVLIFRTGIVGFAVVVIAQFVVHVRAGGK